MWRRKAPAPPPVDAHTQLALRVVRNVRVTVAEDAPQRLVVELPLTYPRWLGPLPRWWKLKERKRYELEGLPLAVWRRIDDRRTVDDLIAWLADSERLTWLEARLLTLTWLHGLAGRGLVVLVG
jgi:hypothetical protein